MLSIHSGSDHAELFYTPQQLLTDLGKPDFVKIMFPNDSDFLASQYYFLKRGLSILFVQEIPVEQREDRVFCLGDPVHSIWFDIVAPADSLDPIKLTPIQAYAFLDYPNFMSVESMGVTVEDFTELAVQQENPCFTIPPDPS